MTDACPKLFTPISIGKVEIKNRIAMAPMGLVGLTNADGSLSQRAMDYYIERARGGVGLIITSLFGVTPKLVGMVQPRIDRMTISSLGELCETVHSLGSRIFIQLTAGWGRVGRTGPRGELLAPSATPCYWDPSIICRPMTINEIEALVKAFGNAAQIVAFSGVDGVELHGHEGYLFDQFTTAIWNKRTDRYGGDLKGRLTFCLEILAEIKKRAGADFPVQYRFGLKHYIKGLNAGALPGEKYTEAGRDIAEGLEMARLLEKAGFDSLHVDAGCYDSWYWAHPPVYQEHGCMVDMAARVKKVVKIPVIAVGRLDTPELAAAVIEQGQADMIAVGRGLLADPYWPVKVQEQKIAGIRPCIGCHDGCMGRFSTGKPLSCAVNPACGRERFYGLEPAPEIKKVMVIGGGVAGMEAARVAAARGHKVTLYEKEKSLGGHLIEASVPDFKKDLRRLRQWYEGQLENLGVAVKTGTAASVNLIRRENPDVVCVATGSKPLIPNIPGIDNSKVVTAVDLLLGRKQVGETVSVIGGGLIGCEVALWLAQQGKRVTILEALPELMSGGIPVPHMNRVMLLDLLAFNQVQMMTQAKIIEVGNENIMMLDGNARKKHFQADSIVLSVGLKPDSELYYQLKGVPARTYRLGDCRQAGNIMVSIWDAYEVGRSI